MQCTLQSHFVVVDFGILEINVEVVVWKLDLGEFQFCVIEVVYDGRTISTCGEEMLIF